MKDVILDACGPPCRIVRQTGFRSRVNSFDRMIIVSTGYLFGMGMTLASRRSTAS